jgi:carboxylesterase
MRTPSATEIGAPGRRAMSSTDGLGVLVLHGFTGTPATMQPLAEAISACGFAVSVPLLSGHGTSVDDLERTTYEDFLASAQTAYDELAAHVDTVAVAGLSMGGALAVDLALANPVVGLVLVNPFLEPPVPSFLALLEAAVASGSRSIPSIGSDIARPGVRGTGYDETPLKPLLSLLGGVVRLAPRLSELGCPVLLFSSRTDHVVPPSTGDFFCARATTSVERVFLEHSYHVATLDHDAPELCARAAAFLEKLSS